MQFIEHIVEPSKLLMTWQSSDKQYRTRYVVAELQRIGEKVTLKYFADTADFNNALDLGFEPYPAFPNVKEIYESGVLDALMRRLPPKSRGDYTKYLEGFRIKPETSLSNFALLGYTGARLPSDGFALVNPFNNVDSSFEFLLEATGYRYLKNVKVNFQDKATFKNEFDTTLNEEVIKIFVVDQHIGYVTRALIPSFRNWINSNRIIDAWVEKKNGSPEQPIVYLYVKMAGKTGFQSQTKPVE